MTVNIHFETLASGMKAKLYAGYRTHGNCVINVRKLSGNELNTGSLDDSIGKYQKSLVRRNK